MSTTAGHRAGPGLGVPLDWLATDVAGRRAVATAVAAGLVLDLAVRTEVAGVAGALAVVLATAAVLAGGTVANPQALALLVAAPVFGAWMAVRASPWLVVPDGMAAAGLLLAGASLAPGGSLLDLSVPAAAARAAQLGAHLLAVPRFVLGPRRGRAGPGTGLPAWLVGVALAVPLLLALGALLASADAVFASFFRLPTQPGDVASHVVVVGVGAAGALALVRATRGAPPELPEYDGRRLGPTEASIVLGSLVGLFAAFAAAQVVAATGGARTVIETAGLTYAEYARSGFFQLLVVAGLTLATLLVLRAVTRLPSRAAEVRFVVLAEAAALLTIVIVAVAVRRLLLYEQAFGWTMLRLYSTVFALWIGAVFAALGVALAGVGRGRHWLPPVAGLLALATLLGLNVVSPEAYVVRHNLDRTAATGRFDGGYLASLSADAVPALVDGLAALPVADQADVQRALCNRFGRDRGGWPSYNRAEQRARDAVAPLCPAPS